MFELSWDLQDIDCRCKVMVRKGSSRFEFKVENVRYEAQNLNLRLYTTSQLKPCIGYDMLAIGVQGAI